jgi:hypothetical protein
MQQGGREESLRAESAIAARSAGIGSFGGRGRRGRQLATSTMEAVTTGAWHRGGSQRAIVEWSGMVDHCDMGLRRAGRPEASGSAGNALETGTTDVRRG